MITSALASPRGHPMNVITKDFYTYAIKILR
jgi:hypothetical protein